MVFRTLEPQFREKWDVRREIVSGSYLMSRKSWSVNRKLNGASQQKSHQGSNAGLKKLISLLQQLYFI